MPPAPSWQEPTSTTSRRWRRKTGGKVRRPAEPIATDSISSPVGRKKHAVGCSAERWFLPRPEIGAAAVMSSKAVTGSIRIMYWRGTTHPRWESVRHHLSRGAAPDMNFMIRSPTDRRRGEIKNVDLAALEAQSADQHRSFLATWRGRVPSDLVIVYLGLIGRSEPFRRLANEWAIDATADVDTLWADLDNHFPREILYPNPLADEVDQRRFLIEPVAGEHVQAIAMSGDLFDAPLGGPGKGILIGNLHKSHEGIRAADGKVRSLITLPVRQVDPSGYGQKEASGIFRRFVETDRGGLPMARHGTPT